MACKEDIKNKYGFMRNSILNGIPKLAHEYMRQINEQQTVLDRTDRNLIVLKEETRENPSLDIQDDVFCHKILSLEEDMDKTQKLYEAIKTTYEKQQMKDASEILENKQRGFDYSIEYPRAIIIV